MQEREHADDRIDHLLWEHQAIFRLQFTGFIIGSTALKDHENLIEYRLEFGFQWVKTAFLLFFSEFLS